MHAMAIRASRAKAARLFTAVVAAVILAVFSPPIAAQSDLDRKVADLLDRMTLAEKIGQMTQVDRTGLVQIDDIRRYCLGSLLSGGDSTPRGTTPAKMADFVDECQKAALRTRLRIPLLYGIDAVHGFASLAGTVVFPHNIGMGAAGDPALAEKAARITAAETAAAGVRWTFAPCVAVARDERWGRTYESYGETPDLPSALGVAAIRGFQGPDPSKTDSVIACAKHYVGDGGTLYGTGLYGGIDQGDTRVTEAVLRRLHLPPFAAAVKAGVRTIMVSFSSWNGTKLHEHRYLLTKVLKEELGFSGFVVSDWQGYRTIPRNYDEQIAAAFNAGIDMMMVVNDYARFIETTVRLVEEGRIPRARIDDAVRRILKVKYEAGLFDRPCADRRLLAAVGSRPHREIARECVRRSLVLLKNSRKMLPLAKDLKTIAVAGKYADDLGSQCGGWTVSWQGHQGAITTGTTILQGIRAAVSPRTKVIHTPDGRAAAGADAAVVVVGEPPYAEFRGDVLDPAGLALDEEDRQTIWTIAEAGVPMVVVLISGRPLLVAEELQKSRAFIAAWLPGTEGQGVADVLFGDYKPTGKLSFSWPRDMEQIPINAGDQDYDPLFKYGYGLSY